MGTGMQCDYHPTQTAWWQCRKCRKALCPQCIIRRKGGFQESQSIFLCPKCNQVADGIEIGQIVTPFWRRLHKCFVYPLSALPSVILIFGLALLSSFFSGPGLLSLVIRFVLWAVMLKYAYEALRSTAEGRLRPPPLSEKTLSSNFQLVFKQIGLFIAIFLLFGFVVVGMDPWAWIIFGLAVIIGLPAMIITLAINDNLGQALNPVNFIGMPIRIGWGYLLLFFFLTLLLSAPGALGYYFIQHMPEPLQLFLWHSAKNYYTLVSYHLMGYVILQYHDRLGRSVDIETLLANISPESELPSAQNSASPAGNPQRDLLTEVGILIQEGKLDRAISEIQERTQLKIDNPELSDRYIQLLQTQNRTAELLAYAPRQLDRLIMGNEKEKALALYLSCSQGDDDFAPSATALFKIGSWFNENGQARDAVKTFNRLIKSHPADALVPKTCYKAAELLHEQLKNTEKAKSILKTLVRKYPDHDIAPFAKKYLTTL
jgi:tetratricopeptide (TPR) repeat protein